jgi:hypothetical protein
LIVVAEAHPFGISDVIRRPLRGIVACKTGLFGPAGCMRFSLRAICSGAHCCCSSIDTVWSKQ